ncbi:MAG TPA: ABC transporter ATP-binding protein [Acidobacteriaceae bacterium]
MTPAIQPGPEIARPPAVIAQLQDVSKLYGTFVALRHITLNLHAGRCYVLLGDNGAGKSTLLRMLAGLLAPTYGTLRIFNQTPSDARTRIGYMSHAPMLYDAYSALENLAYYAALYPPVPGLMPEQALALVALDPTLGRPLAQYSQGMRQRVSLARVLLSEPALLLLDEPFSNMDRASALQMLALLDRLRTQGRTIVLTTHQRELAEPLSDQLLLLHAGRLTVEERA